MILFLYNKYICVFKDKGFNNEKLRTEINKLLSNQKFKAFDYQLNLKKVEKTIFAKVSKWGILSMSLSKLKNELLNFDKDKYLLESEKNPQKNKKLNKKSKSKS